MPDVIIKGMEMPETCYECPCGDNEFYECMATPDRNSYHRDEYGYQDGERQAWCPLRPALEWISVEERLPETRNSILGQKSSKVIVAFQFDDGAQGTDTSHTLNGDWVFEDRIVVVNRIVTHWMSLPEPPEGGGRDG